MPFDAPLVVTNGSRLSASTPWAMVNVPDGAAAACGVAAGAVVGFAATAGAVVGPAAGALEPHAVSKVAPALMPRSAMNCRRVRILALTLHRRSDRPPADWLRAR